MRKPLGNKLCISMWSCLPFIFYVAFAVGDEPPTLANIRKESNDRLSKPLKFRVRLGPFETMVSQKTLANGVVARRVEAMQSSQTVVVTLGDDAYDILDQSRVVIDKSKISLGTFPRSYLLGNEMSFSFVYQPPYNRKILDQRLESVVYDRVPCYCVTTTYSYLQLSDKSLMLGVLGRGTEAETREFLNKETLYPLCVELSSPSGAMFRKYEYLEFIPSPDMPDDFFLIPSEYRRETPKTMKEYFSLHSVFWADIRPVPKFRLPYPNILEPPDMSRYTIKIDPETRIPVPKGSTVDEMKQLIREVRKSRIGQTQEIIPTRAGSRTFWFVLLNVVAVAFLGWIVAVRIRRKADS